MSTKVCQARGSTRAHPGETSTGAQPGVPGERENRWHPIPKGLRSSMHETDVMLFIDQSGLGLWVQVWMECIGTPLILHSMLHAYICR